MAGQNIPALYGEMLRHRDESQVRILSGFFKTGPGQYGEGDLFLGIKVPVTRGIVKDLWSMCTFQDLETCISSPYHEIRLAALLTLVRIFHNARRDTGLQQHCVDFYLSHTRFINNWDLVDLSCYEILGSWLYDRDPSILYRLADKGTTIWEQRIGIVSTMAFVRKGRLNDTYAISDIFLSKPRPLHDLLQKAVGWLLREAGKRDPERLMQWLEERCATMPRTMLRYSVEHMSESQRSRFLSQRAQSHR